MTNEIWEASKKFFGTIGASLAGVTAILYAAGFLANGAHLSMLGLSGVTVANIDYLKAGGVFFMDSLFCLQTALISLPYYISSIKWIIILATLFMSILLLVKNKLTKEKHGKKLLHISTKLLNIKRFLQRYTFSLKLLLNLLMIGIGVFSLSFFLDKYVANSGLLFYQIPEDKDARPLKELLTQMSSNPDQHKQSIEALKKQIKSTEDWQNNKNNKILRLILEEESLPLRVDYGLLFLWVIVFGIFIFSVNPINNLSENSPHDNTISKKIGKYILNFVFLPLWGMELFLLPIIFGHTIKKNYFQICEVEFNTNVENVESSKLYAIIYQSDENLMLYDRLGGRQVVIYKKNDIKTIRLLGSKFVFNDNNFKRKENISHVTSNLK